MIRLYVRHRSADLWLLDKEVGWWASVPRRGPATGREKVENSMFSFIQVDTDSANKCFGKCWRGWNELTCQERGVEKSSSSWAAGHPALTPPSPCPSSGSGMGCLRRHCPAPGGGTAELRVASLSPWASGALNLRHWLFKALPLAWHFYLAVSWWFNPLAGQSGWGDLAVSIWHGLKALCVLSAWFTYPACQSPAKLAAAHFTLLVTY